MPRVAGLWSSIPEFAIRELNSSPSIGVPFKRRPSLMSPPLMRKRSPAMETTVCVSGMELSDHVGVWRTHYCVCRRLSPRGKTAQDRGSKKSIVGKSVLRAVEHFLDEAQERGFHRAAVDAVGRGFQHVAI